MTSQYVIGALLAASLLVGVAHAEFPDIRKNAALNQDSLGNMVDDIIARFAVNPEHIIQMINSDTAFSGTSPEYSFIVDSSGHLLAHGSTPNMVGQDMHTIPYEDSSVGMLLVENASPYGKWIQYEWHNPQYNETVLNIVWIRAWGGYIFGGGVYVDPNAASIMLTENDVDRQRVAQNVVQDVLFSFARDPEWTVDAIGEIDLFEDAEVYPFIVDVNGTVMAHGHSPDLVGTDAEFVFDTEGTSLGDLLEANATPYGRWIDYYWPNPLTYNIGETKLAWVTTLGGFIFAAGMYPETPDYERNPIYSWRDIEERRVSMDIMDAVVRDFANNPAATIDAIHDTDDILYRDGSTYVAIINMAGDIVAHGADATVVGTNLYDIEYDGTSLGDRYMPNASPYGKWVEYNDRGTAVMVMLKIHGPHIFAVVMEPEYYNTSNDLTQYERDRQRIVRAMVQQSVESFMDSPLSTINAINAGEDPLYHDMEIFPYIVNFNGTIMAHGGSPSLVGVDSNYLDDSRGNNLWDMLEANITPYGRWIEYHWPNPLEDDHTGEPKLDWVVSRGDYIFGAGIYPDDW